MSETPSISVVVPVYGCITCLTKLHANLEETFAKNSLTWELIFVDDRDPNEHWEKICDLAQKDPRVRGIRLSRNHGQHLAIWAGLDEAIGEWTVVMDCDLQDDPKIIPDLLETATNKKLHAVVVDRGVWSESILRRFGSRIFFRLVHLLSGVELKNIGNFGLYSRKMIDSLLMFNEQEVFLPMMVALTGLKKSVYRVNRSKRADGESSYNFTKLIRLAIVIIIRFSDRPLKISVFIGLSMSLLSVGVSILLVLVWLAGNIEVPGWTSSLLSMWFLSGLILATLGLQGFYLGRIFEEVKKRPRILIEEKTSPSAPTK
jgi:glycosyltransferase involved in cell wall biosynthesis